MFYFETLEEKTCFICLLALFDLKPEERRQDDQPAKEIDLLKNETSNHSKAGLHKAGSWRRNDCYLDNAFRFQSYAFWVLLHWDIALGKTLFGTEMACYNVQFPENQHKSWLAYKMWYNFINMQPKKSYLSCYLNANNFMLLPSS